MADLPILYSFRRCPYAMRARLALWVSGAQVELREVKLAAKPQEMLDASAKGTVPVLLPGDGSVIDESLDIMRWALNRNDPEGWLAGDPADLILQNDGPFKHHLDRYKYPNRYDNCDPLEHRAAGLEILQRLEVDLAGRANLQDERRRLADMAIFPFIRQFANTDRAWFDALPIKGVQTWLERHLQSDAFAAIMPRFSPWQDGDTPIIWPTI